MWKALVVVVALTGAMALATRLLTWFGVWDDEGYVLVTLSHYMSHGHLYTQTFTQYGPFFFYAQALFFQLFHLPLTHDMGRLVTLIYWVASSVLAAVFISRATKSLFLASAAGFCVMLAGLVLTNEPGHPQQVLLVLYMIAACLSQFPHLTKSSYLLRLVLLGCIGAALLFTKVNVGVFFIAGLAQALICLLPIGKIRWLGLGLMLLYAAAVPWLLMRAGFADGFRGYCAVATASALVTLAFGALLKTEQPLPWRAVLYAATGLLAGIGLTVAATALQGMSFDSLISGVLLGPMHHPKVFDLVLYISGRQVMGELVVLAAVVALGLWGRRLNARWLDYLRCAAGMVAIFLLTLPDSATLVVSPVLGDPLSVLVDSSVHRIQWVVLLLPLTLIPQRHWPRDAGSLFPRLFITFMAATQFLEPFPVAGSQLGIAATPMILWAFLCIGDGVAGLRAASTQRAAEVRDGLGLDALLAGLILFVLAGLSLDLSFHSRFPPPSTRLKGTTWVHLPAEQTSEYESVAASVSRNCDMLFTMPGMGSFNIWSGVPTPNGWNLTAWMKGFGTDRQAEILSILRSDPEACAVVNPRIVHFWEKDEASIAALPLAHYLTMEMPKVAWFGAYELHVHPERKSPWLDGGGQQRSVR